jgi:hypothetical protein
MANSRAADLLSSKIGRSISAAEKVKEVFGIALPTPCPTRWNSLYNSLSSFLKHYKSLDAAGTVFRSLGIPVPTKDDLDLLIEYMQCVKPSAAILDIFQGDKGCFLGIGVVLPLLTKLKKQLNQRVFPNLGPLRDQILSRIQDRYEMCNIVSVLYILSRIFLFRFGHLFLDNSYLISACTHPFF